jgi:ferrous iron transport protein B
MDMRPVKTATIALVGAPGSGKRSQFNLMTGLTGGADGRPGDACPQSGAKRTGQVVHNGWSLTIVELPGLTSLTSLSPEDRISRDFLQDEAPDLIVNLLDADTLERSLYLTTQLIELGIPRVHALNAPGKGGPTAEDLKTDDLAAMLGGPVIRSLSGPGRDVTPLLDAITCVLDSDCHDLRPDPPDSPLKLRYDSHLEAAIGRVRDLVAALHPRALTDTESRWLSIKLLEGDDEIVRREKDHEDLIAQVNRERETLAATHGKAVATMFADSRYGFINGLLMECRDESAGATGRLMISGLLDRVLMNRWVGFPLFILMMWGMFEATFTLGEIPMGWIEAGVAWVSGAVAATVPEGLLHDMLVDGLIAGVGGTIIFLPNIVILFCLLAFLSESGYLARTTFLMDRVMHIFGMHGKSFVPLVMGFGCNVPAIMAARTIESPRARLIAVLVTPFIACSARLPVFILIAGAFFADWAGSVVFLMYVLSIGCAMLAAVMLNRVLVRGPMEPTVMDLPPYRLPSIRTVLYHMWESASEFLKKVAGVILVGSVLIWFLQAFPQTTPDAALADDPAAQARAHLEQSYLGQAAQTVAPVFAPLGFGWEESVAIMTGLVAKEVVVASFAVIHAKAEDTPPESRDLRAALAGTMTPLVAFGFMVFILLYSPCVATIAVIRRETGRWGWVVFSLGFSFVFGWTLTFLIVTVGGLLT